MSVALTFSNALIDSSKTESIPETAFPVLPQPGTTADQSAVSRCRRDGAMSAVSGMKSYPDLSVLLCFLCTCKAMPAQRQPFQLSYASFS